MNKLQKVGGFLIVISLTLPFSPVQAFNPLTHIHIAEKACPDCYPKVDYYYCSIAPDIVLYAARDLEALFSATHVTDIDLSSSAVGCTQEACAKGWLTHGQNPVTPGADYFAHISYWDNLEEGYVIEKADALIGDLPDDIQNHPRAEDFAHYVIETTIDWLLKEKDPLLPLKLLYANFFRSWKDRNLMVKVLVWKNNRTDWPNLFTAELTFRNLISQYGNAIFLPYPHDKEALAQLGAQLALQMFGIYITSDELLEIFDAAIGLCQDSFYDVIQEAIDAVSNNLN